MKDLKLRHMAIMDALLAYPAKSHQELAKMLGYSESRFSTIINQPTFKLALAEYRRKFEAGLLQTIQDATAKAIKAAQEIIEDKAEPTPVRQESIRDLLALGHAKAIERKATLAMEAQIPKEAFAALSGLVKELEQPFTPTKLLQKKEGDDADEAAEILEADQVIQAG